MMSIISVDDTVCKLLTSLDILLTMFQLAFITTEAYWLKFVIAEKNVYSPFKSELVLQIRPAGLRVLNFPISIVIIEKCLKTCTKFF